MIITLIHSQKNMIITHHYHRHHHYHHFHCQSIQLFLSLRVGYAKIWADIYIFAKDLFMFLKSSTALFFVVVAFAYLLCSLTFIAQEKKTGTFLWRIIMTWKAPVVYSRKNFRITNPTKSRRWRLVCNMWSPKQEKEATVQTPESKTFQRCKLGKQSNVGIGGYERGRLAW